MQEIIKIPSRINDIELDFIYPDNWDGKKIMLFCHGFNSGKGSESYTIIGEKFLEKGIAYAKFSLPYHAERRLDYKDLTVENCIEDSELVEEYLRKKYLNAKLGILGTSFGGYLTLLRLNRFKHNYFVIILKSPAIKMDKIFRRYMTDDEFEFYKNQGFVINDFKEDGMRISFDFYKELQKNQIMDLEKFDEEILLYHGTIDDTAPYEDSVEFATNNKNVILHPLIGENHRYTRKVLDDFSEEIAEYAKEK